MVQVQSLAQEFTHSLGEIKKEKKKKKKKKKKRKKSIIAGYEGKVYQAM